MAIECMNLVRECEFREFINETDEQELLRQRNLLQSEIAQKYATIRSNVSDLMRERLAIIDRTLGLTA